MRIWIQFASTMQATNPTKRHFPDTLSFKKPTRLQYNTAIRLRILIEAFL